MSLCIAAAGHVTALASTVFSLSWTHTVEKIEWQEDWRVTPAGLVILEARVQGTGAGMEPPDGARLEAGWWRYKPGLPAQRTLNLALGEGTGGWRLCTPDTCLDLNAAYLERAGNTQRHAPSCLPGSGAECAGSNHLQDKAHLRETAAAVARLSPCAPARTDDTR
ncbi:MAG: DUF1850 domain-containing protein [Hyphomicrobiaceae bacterium]|nr:DUF1850 domain-containing protein [Hyphomicrobiaceae bacterium]